MWYHACKTCNKKVTETIGSGFWCEGCQKNDEECSLRYIMVAKVSDASGEAWLSTFNDQAEKIVGCSADELDKLKSQVNSTCNKIDDFCIYYPVEGIKVAIFKLMNQFLIFTCCDFVVE